MTTLTGPFIPWCFPTTVYVVLCDVFRHPSLNSSRQDPDSHCGMLNSTPVPWGIHQSTKPFIPTGIDKLVAIKLTMHFWSWKMANVNACGCTMAYAWLTQPMAWFPCAGFLQLLSSLKFILRLSGVVDSCSNWWAFLLDRSRLNRH